MIGRGHERRIDRNREATFVLVLFVGVGLTALGVAFVILGLTVTTRPPAPSILLWHKRVLVGSSLVAIIGGLLTIRVAGHIVGW